ncbi:MAG: hypothetical protein CL676_02535 [Bdellovibrionaceae bacterium]|nr:hypothetical protein [Pseudobdellovibrionaceae bacterium]|tara:strand:- start:2004 stop:2642 length:639 start_codon:yes stop_codon:yes gene_type:complete
MRWVTPQELSKIARKSPDSEKNISERTVRHMALQKRIITKKVGKSWLIDPASALKAGLYIEQSDLENLKVTEMPQESSSLNENKKKVESGTPNEKRKFKSLGELGVYSELKALYLNKEITLPEPIRESIKQTLFHLALGFYEYPKVNKAEYFKRARKFLVGAIVEDDLTSAEQSEWRNQLENSIMPGIVGLIRKQEGGKSGGRGQAQTKRKD